MSALVSTEDGLQVRSQLTELNHLPAGLVLDSEIVAFNAARGCLLLCRVEQPVLTTKMRRRPSFVSHARGNHLGVYDELDLPEPSPADRVSALDTEQASLSRRLAQVRQVIADMERLDSLTPFAAAALAKYRQNEANLASELARTEVEIGKLLSQEPEAVLEFDRFHAADPSEDDMSNPAA